MHRLIPACLLALLPMAGCAPEAADGPIDVSIIGDAPGLADADRRPLTPSQAVMLSAVAQGLVRFDGAGQIEPGAAQRWAVSDDGLYYTFRIDSGGPIGAEDAARRLRRALAATSRNPLKPVLGAIDEVVAVTPEVVEIRLHSPRPNLLQLLAQPELAFRARTGKGSGPFLVTAKRRGTLLLTPAVQAEATEEGPPTGQVRLRGERAAMAVARFAAGGAAAVIGGRYGDLPIVRVADIAPRLLRIDPATGLFGLAFTRADGFFGSAENRRALSMAIDRAQLTAAFQLPNWREATTLLPPGVPDLPISARPDWADTPLADRQAIAADAVARWTMAEGSAPVVRVALPEGPGSRLIFAALRRDWARIGVVAESAVDDGKADLRLIDDVAPGDIASWYMRRFTCDLSRVCSEQADASLIAARDAPTLAERALRLTEADRRLTEITAFIPLASPLRWSLAEPRSSGLQVNPRATHPLNHLRRE